MIYYNIHNLVKIKLFYNNAREINYLEKRLKYFKTLNFVSSDINVYFNTVPKGVTKRYLNGLSAKKEIIYNKGKRYFARWEACINSEEEGGINLFFSGNVYACKYLFFNFLEPLINRSLVNQGFALIHSSCFSLSGKGYLVTAYPASGKTSILLRMLEKGADYISDEMTIISKDGFVYMYPTPVVLSDYNMSRYVTDKLGFLSHIKKYALKVVRILTKGFIKLTIKISPEILLNGGKIINSSKIKQVYIIKKGYPEKEDMNDISEIMLRISKVQYDYFAKVIRKHRAKIKDSNLNQYWNNMAEVINSFCQNTKDLYIEKNNNINFDRLKK